MQVLQKTRWELLHYVATSLLCCTYPASTTEPQVDASPRKPQQFISFSFITLDCVTARPNHHRHYVAHFSKKTTGYYLRWDYYFSFNSVKVPIFVHVNRLVNRISMDHFFCWFDELIKENTFEPFFFWNFGYCITFMSTFSLVFHKTSMILNSFGKKRFLPTVTM